MPSLIQTLASHLSGTSVSEMSLKLGADPAATENAVSAALPVLMGALARNASRPEGADALHQALARDHDGSVMGDVRGFLDGQESATGDGILRHVLGTKREAVESGIGQASGLDAQKTSQLMTMLAPLVMGVLGQRVREGSLDAGGLSGLLDGERKETEGSGGVAGLIGGLLDRDGDGSAIDDVAGTLLGSLFDRGRS